MKKHIGIRFIGFCMAMFLLQSAFAVDSRVLINLNGKWKFNIGDDMKWAEPKFDDKDWDNINVSGTWENQGYVGYDGFAWYRRKVSMPQVDEDKTLYIYIRNIDDADEVYFNGHKIGATGNFPPQYQTAYDWTRKYVIPFKYINKEGENVIAIRVYDEGGEGGMIWNDVNICFDENESYIDYSLSGSWKFKLYDNKNWKNPDFDDSTWKTLQVPMSWESQGYFNYDGNAWYRKSFTIPENLKNKKLYLCLGRIDDYDKVYFNGEWIGEVSPSKEKSMCKRFRGEYATRRLYEIPQKLIKEGINVIAVKTYDIGGAGGIYEGPIGLMAEKNAKEYKELPDWKYEYNGREYNNVGDFIGEFFEDLFGND